MLEKLRVMVVDDNADSADVVAILLHSFGHDVKVEYGAVSALASVTQYEPHLLLLDIGMPEIDGFELVRRMRVIPELASSMFVAISGYCDQDSRDAARAAGFHRFLSKPFDVTALLELIAVRRTGTLAQEIA